MLWEFWKTYQQARLEDILSILSFIGLIWCFIVLIRKS